jgi:hypothetical protein
LRKSTGFVAISTRIGPGGISIPPLMRWSAKPRATETERPWTSSLNKEYRPGTYLCADQGTVVFDSVLMSAADKARL